MRAGEGALYDGGQVQVEGIWGDCGRVKSTDD